MEGKTGGKTGSNGAIDVVEYIALGMLPHRAVLQLHGVHWFYRSRSHWSFLRAVLRKVELQLPIPWQEYYGREDKSGIYLDFQSSRVDQEPERNAESWVSTYRTEYI